MASGLAVVPEVVEVDGPVCVGILLISEACIDSRVDSALLPRKDEIDELVCVGMLLISEACTDSRLDSALLPGKVEIEPRGLGVVDWPDEGEVVITESEVKLEAKMTVEVT